jgi:hypothetical protein
LEDELVIEHPTDVLPGPEVAAVVAGPAIYLVALSLFRLRMVGSISPSRLVGAPACVAIGALGAVAPGLVPAGSVVAVPAAVIAYEHAKEGRCRVAADPSSL